MDTVVQEQQSCSKCVTKGVGVTTCNGCQQSLCVKHFVEHRKDLSDMIENVCFEHNLLRNDIDEQYTKSPVLEQINLWERESILKVQQTAENMRRKLAEFLNQNQKELTFSLRQIANDIQSCRQSDDYTENHIQKWTQQLETFRRSIKELSNVFLVDDETLKSKINLIEIQNQNDYAVENENDEKFGEIIGCAIKSDDDLVVTTAASSVFASPTIYGMKTYSSGIHRITFRIENIGNLQHFIGITSFNDTTNESDKNPESLYGWWDQNKPVISGKLHDSDEKQIVSTGDKITLILDCDNRQILLQHHRTCRSARLHINIVNCPFPWKIIVHLKKKDDSIRIVQ